MITMCLHDFLLTTHTHTNWFVAAGTFAVICHPVTHKHKQIYKLKIFLFFHTRPVHIPWLFSTFGCYHEWLKWHGLHSHITIIENRVLINCFYKSQELTFLLQKNKKKKHLYWFTYILFDCHMMNGLEWWCRLQ